uniref:Loricrin-like n=1 Tax=Crassostrea virginica TaxID=6565 RepID=A0A8B8B4E9_CRAVI|nr:loricrin-like [Crassostrea virginica]
MFVEGRGGKGMEVEGVVDGGGGGMHVCTGIMPVYGDYNVCGGEGRKGDGGGGVVDGGGGGCMGIIMFVEGGEERDGGGGVVDGGGGGMHCSPEVEHSITFHHIPSHLPSGNAPSSKKSNIPLSTALGE